MGSSRELKISVKNLCKTFISKSRTQNEVNEVIKGLNLDIYENEFVVLFGPGQCGKTTILKILAGLEIKTSGSVVVNGKEVTGPETDRGMVYQTTALFPWMKVIDNVAFGPKANGVKKSVWKKTLKNILIW